MRISVIIPSYNSKETISRAIESVLDQTVSAHEIIVIDDASTDDTVKHICDLYGSVGKITILNQMLNGGPSIARNRGIQVSTGDWISLLDSDDAWEKDRLERLSQHIEGVDVIADNITSFDAIAGVKAGSFYKFFSPGPVTLDEFVNKRRKGHEFDYGYLKPIVRKEFLMDKGISYNVAARHAEDYLFYLECLILGARFTLAPAAGYIYTTWVGEISRKRSPHSKTKSDGKLLSTCIIALIEKHGERLSQSEIKLLHDEARVIHRSAGAWAFHDALRHRNLFKIALLMLREASAREAMKAEILGRISRRSGRREAI